MVRERSDTVPGGDRRQDLGDEALGGAGARTPMHATAASPNEGDVPSIVFDETTPVERVRHYPPYRI